MPRQVLLYMPVIHEGYERLLQRYAVDSEILLLGESFGTKYKVLRKDIRALEPSRAAEYLAKVYLQSKVNIVELADLPSAIRGPLLITPDEQLMRDVVEDFGLNAHVRVEFAQTFLRWDRKWSGAKRPPRFAGTTTAEALPVAFAELATRVGNRSSDWWRQVGAVAVRGGAVLAAAHNEHAPSAYSPYLQGDPRNDYRRGRRLDVSTALHAEAGLVGRAARSGIRLGGSDLYVSTFPCPACARLIAEAGFSRCFFAGGYSVMDGEEILSAAGVELVFVDLKDSPRQLDFDALDITALLST